MLIIFIKILSQLCKATDLIISDSNVFLAI